MRVLFLLGERKELANVKDIVNLIVVLYGDPVFDTHEKETIK